MSIGIKSDVYQVTTAIRKMSRLRKRIKGIPGGTSAGKTFGILPILITRGSQIPGLEISVVSESLPHLKKGAIKDFKKIMKATGRWLDSRWNETSKKYTFHNGSYIEFFSADDSGKVHGPRRSKLYINECNRISFETYHALMIRTSEDIWLDFNPTRKFWYHTEIVGDPDWEECRLTFQDNEGLPDQIRKDILKGKDKGYHDPEGDINDPNNIKNEYWANWWRVYGLGLLGKMEGQIFVDVGRCYEKDIPDGEMVVGIDFGYTHDPTAVVKLVNVRGTLYMHQLLYKTGVKVQDIVDALYEGGVLETHPVLCDHDFTAIDDIQKAGFRAMRAHKPAGSVLAGIQALQSVQLVSTYESDGLHVEEERYFWDQKDGKFLNRPIDDYNHAWDAIRYGYDYLVNPQREWYVNQKKKKSAYIRKRKIFKMS